MSEAKAPEKAPAKKEAGKKKAAAGKSGGGFTGRMRSWFSAAGCAAALTALFLTVVVIAVWTVFWLEPSNIPWRHAMSWTRILVTVLLVIAIPLVLYKAIRLWLEGDDSLFPDIDFAWRSGLSALSQNGLSPTSAPLFLVLGSSGNRQESSLVQAAGLSLRVNNVPEGPAPLHWYASPDGIYLVLSETCGLSSLAVLLEKRRAKGENLKDASSPAPLLAAQLATPRAAPAVASRAMTPAGGSRGTIMLDQFVAEAHAAQLQSAKAAHVTADNDPEQESVSMAPVVSDQPAILSPQEAMRQRARLAYVCQLIRQARFPVCPINGVLVMLPFELLSATQRETQQLQKTMRSDLATLQRELLIRCPVTALIVGMHQERGFRELVRRVGRERAIAQRFGKRFDVRVIPTAEALGALCVQAVGVFEDWIHTLFREAEALSRPGNLRLYGLLCKVRSTFSNVLGEVLVGGIGHEAQSRDLPEPIAFSGCYFAATGESDDQQAFVKGIFEKLVEEQEEIEWTRTSVERNRRSQIFATIAGSLAAVCLMAIVGIAVWRLAD